MLKFIISLSIISLLAASNLRCESFGFGIKQFDKDLVPGVFFSASELLSYTIDKNMDKNSSTFISVSGKIGYLSDSLYYNAIKGAYYGELALMSNIKPHRYLGEVSYLTGIILPTKYLTFELNAGVGCVFGNKRGKLLESSGGLFSSEKYEELKFATVCLPLVVGFYFNISHFMRLGFIVQANLNPETSTASLGMSLSLGTITKQEPVKKRKKLKKINIE